MRASPDGRFWTVAPESPTRPERRGISTPSLPSSSVLRSAARAEEAEFVGKQFLESPLLGFWQGGGGLNDWMRVAAPSYKSMSKGAALLFKVVRGLNQVPEQMQPLTAHGSAHASAAADPGTGVLTSPPTPPPHGTALLLGTEFPGRSAGGSWLLPPRSPGLPPPGSPERACPQARSLGV